MDFDDTPEEAAFRAAAREWLEANAIPKGAPDDFSAGYFSGELDPAEYVKRCRWWQGRLYEGGWAGISWPRRFGGRGGKPVEEAIFAEEQARYGVSTGAFAVAIGMVGATLMQHGTPEQRSRWLQPILRCEEVWCQGFSEPEAGSDLAALRTSARVVGDRYVINGQKIWTSGATYADWMFALVRTDPDAPKHRGITAVLIDMRSPGIEVRPIRQINGRRTFAEVFLDDVEVPVANTVGEMGDGWNVAMSALVLERGIGRRSYVKYLPLLQELRHLAIASGGADDSATLEELGWHVMQVCRYRHHVGRTIAESSDGRFGPEASLNKLFWSEMEAAIYETGMRLHALATATGTEPALSERYPLWEADYWHARATRIFAGSNQIQRNIIAERVLGMPKEKR